MSLERIVAILLLVIQIGNAGAFFLEGLAPEYAYIVAAVVGGLQAFVSKIQSSKK